MNICADDKPWAQRGFELPQQPSKRPDEQTEKHHFRISETIALFSFELYLCTHDVPHRCKFRSPLRDTEYPPVASPEASTYLKTTKKNPHTYSKYFSLRLATDVCPQQTTFWVVWSNPRAEIEGVNFNKTSVSSHTNCTDITVPANTHTHARTHIHRHTHIWLISK